MPTDGGLEVDTGGLVSDLGATEAATGAIGDITTSGIDQGLTFGTNEAELLSGFKQGQDLVNTADAIVTNPGRAFTDPGTWAELAKIAPIVGGAGGESVLGDTLTSAADISAAQGQEALLADDLARAQGAYASATANQQFDEYGHLIVDPNLIQTIHGDQTNIADLQSYLDAADKYQATVAAGELPAAGVPTPVDVQQLAAPGAVAGPAQVDVQQLAPPAPVQLTPEQQFQQLVQGEGVDQALTQEAASGLSSTDALERLLKTGAGGENPIDNLAKAYGNQAAAQAGASGGLSADTIKTGLVETGVDPNVAAGITKAAGTPGAAGAELGTASAATGAGAKEAGTFGLGTGGASEGVFGPGNEAGASQFSAFSANQPAVGGPAIPTDANSSPGGTVASGTSSPVASDGGATTAAGKAATATPAAATGATGNVAQDVKTSGLDKLLGTGSTFSDIGAVAKDVSPFIPLATLGATAAGLTGNLGNTQQTTAKDFTSNPNIQAATTALNTTNQTILPGVQEASKNVAGQAPKLNTVADTLAETGKTLATGSLSPTQSAASQVALNNIISNIKSNYASMGLSGSSSETQAINDAILKATAADNAASQADQQLGLSTEAQAAGIYQNAGSLYNTSGALLGSAGQLNQSQINALLQEGNTQVGQQLTADQQLQAQIAALARAYGTQSGLSAATTAANATG
jgi:hypothetical protein